MHRQLKLLLTMKGATSHMCLAYVAGVDLGVEL